MKLPCDWVIMFAYLWDNILSAHPPCSGNSGRRSWIKAMFQTCFLNLLSKGNGKEMARSEPKMSAYAPCPLHFLHYWSSNPNSGNGSPRSQINGGAEGNKKVGSHTILSRKNTLMWVCIHSAKPQILNTSWSYRHVAVFLNNTVIPKFPTHAHT